MAASAHKGAELSLSLLQRRLATPLNECLEELRKATPPRRPLAHGFEKGRSIITNAQLHKRRRYVFNLDLADFFPSINFGRVRGFFLKDNTSRCSRRSPRCWLRLHVLRTSATGQPMLAGHLEPHRTCAGWAARRFAKTHKCTNSRYADDITFSTSRKDFPPEIGFFGAAAWQVGDELRARIKDAGFEVNDNKKRMQFRVSRQVTTGLMVNEKVTPAGVSASGPPHVQCAVQDPPAAITGSFPLRFPASAGDPPVKVSDHQSRPGSAARSRIFYQVKNGADPRDDD